MRSKWKRKMRAIKREKNRGKDLERLERLSAVKALDSGETSKLDEIINDDAMQGEIKS